MADNDTSTSTTTEGEGVPEGFKPAYQERSDMMEQIASRANAERDAALRENDPDAPAPDADAEAAARAAEESDRQARETQGAAAPASPGDPVVLEGEALARTKVKVKVDGQESVVDLEALVREAQKNGAADKRLAEATQLLQTVQEQIRAAGTSAPGAHSGDGAGNPNGADASGRAAATPEAVKTTVKTAFDKLYSGDTDAAAEAFAQVLSQQGRGADGAATLPSDPKALQALAAQVQVQIDTNRAINTFKADYRDITENPQLARVADTFLAARMEKGEAFSDALLGAGTDTRAWLKEISGDKSGAPTSSGTTEGAGRAGKRDKATITHIAGAGRVPVSATDTAPPLSSEGQRSSVIEEMARTRRGEKVA